MEPCCRQPPLTANCHNRTLQLPPVSPEDALLGGTRGFLPSDPVLLRSEFLLPLSEQQLELYAWLLSKN